MWLNVFFIVFVMGIITSIVGVLIGNGINSKRSNIVAGLYEISAGMMTGIVCFEMLPESIEISNIYLTLFGCISGVILTLILDIFVNRCKKIKYNSINTSALIIIISMSIHNIVEGIAIGSSFVFSLSLGISILILNLVHDLPETIVVGIGLNKENTNMLKKLIKAVLLGMPTAIGAIFGIILGTISDTYIALSLSLSGGCMLYIVACDLIPSSKEISKKKIVSLIYIIGLLLGLFIINI
ncbi:MAG: ZIP family metal transporter [Clostridia bacterium]|nr:ZIP family metal transporter [Clostridia bacterium]MDD4386323.1 ZIP family metal transporter [Clostridia bacterium]